MRNYFQEQSLSVFCFNLSFSIKLSSKDITEEDCMSQVICLADFEQIAKNKLSSQVYGYFSSGSDEQVTLRQNINAFSHIYLNPRVLVDMSSLSMKTKILGHETNIPFGIAPFAMQKLLHPSGQLLTAKQASQQKTAFGLSMLTTIKLRDVSKINPEGLKIMQLYFMKNADYTLDFIRLVQKSGFHAIAITVDTQMFGKRRRDQRVQFQPQVTLELFQQLGYSFKMRNLDNIQRSFVHQIRNDVSWEDIKWIKRNTHLKIILKGILSPEDVKPAEDSGVDAIWISNHGGRQLDTSPATILVLPSIKRRLKQIQSKMELYIDGGIKKGSDIFKCLALGADFVFLGRGFIYSVVQGEEGVKKAFDILKNQLHKTMMLCGTNSIKAINEDYILKYPQAKL